MFQVTQSWSGAGKFSSFNAGSTAFGFQSRGGFGPTTGRVQVGGSVGSLLELGAGFHMDFTGRENVFLNGAIQGLARAEIGRAHV